MKSAVEGDRSAGRVGAGSAADHSTIYFSTASREGGIAPEFGYFKFSPDKIVVPRLLEGRHDLASWVNSIVPQLEIAQLKHFVVLCDVIICYHILSASHPLFQFACMV
ncbi:hypothetical protein CLOM_g11955 [Closterium sp. NIES-68]|nr:hypothetical protein CLOM_g11955 [Closterium sp. NIES-68]GJP67953.1 hypothetical protein CLOP_g24710 [Closterium sp. NIES-67]